MAEYLLNKSTLFFLIDVKNIQEKEHSSSMVRGNLGVEIYPAEEVYPAVEK